MKVVGPGQNYASSIHTVLSGDSSVIFNDKISISHRIRDALFSAYLDVSYSYKHWHASEVGNDYCPR
jgi:hypothetical protein